MTETYFEVVDPIRFPLINRFYKSCGDKSKAKGGDLVLALKNEREYLAAVRLQSVEDWWFLRSLCVSPDCRRQGLGRKLLSHLTPWIEEKPCYCFPFDYLTELYAAEGFCLADTLPGFIAEQYDRYFKQGRKIVVMTKMYTTSNQANTG